MRKLLPCTFPQPAANSVAPEETKMHRHSTGMAGSGPHWSNPYFDGMGNVHGLILRRCCYSSQIIKIFVWLAVYFGLCSRRSNAFEETQNASTGMLDSITPYFWVLACIDLLEGCMTPCKRSKSYPYLPCTFDYSAAHQMHLKRHKMHWQECLTPLLPYFQSIGICKIGKPNRLHIFSIANLCC